VVRLLVDKGANVNAYSRQYSNALQAALLRGYKAVVRLLRDKGAVKQKQSAQGFLTMR
jgi:ankyrin repeat protein